MNSKPRSNSVLERLPEADQEKLLHWLDTESYSDVLKLVAAPPPEGFGIKTHMTSLYRFYARHRKEEHPDFSDLAREFSALDAENPTLDRAASVAFRQAALQEAACIKPNSPNFRALSRWFLRLQDQELAKRTLALAEKRLELDHEKFMYNAAREALINWDALRDIMKDNTRDDEDRILAARERLFGPLPEHFKKPLAVLPNSPSNPIPAAP